MSTLTDNMAHLATLHAPLGIDGDTVKIAYGYNSGGYENFVYFVTADGGTLAIDTVIAEINSADFTDPNDKQWFIIGYDVNYEDLDLWDDHTGKRITAAYED